MQQATANSSELAVNIGEFHPTHQLLSHALLRSTCGARWLGQIHRTHLWRSTFAGTWVDKEHRMDPPIHMPDAKCCEMSDAKSTRNLDANRIQNSDAKCCKTSDAKCCKMSNAESTHHPAGEHRWIQKDQLVMAKENRNAEKDACQDNTHIDGFVLVVNRPPPNCRRERKSERMLQQDLAAPGSRPQRENRD